MSEQPLDLPGIDLRPLISYPQVAQPNQSYLMTIDVQVAFPEVPWPYLEEEYGISFLLNTSPYFSHEPLDGRWPGVVLHRFGGTYGPAQYLLTAAKQEVGPGHISVTLINGWRLPIGYIELACEVRTETPRRKRRRGQLGDGRAICR